MFWANLPGNSQVLTDFIQPQQLSQHQAVSPLLPLQQDTLKDTWLSLAIGVNSMELSLAPVSNVTAWDMLSLGVLHWLPWIFFFFFYFPPKNKNDREMRGESTRWKAGESDSSKRISAEVWALNYRKPSPSTLHGLTAEKYLLSAFNQMDLSVQNPFAKCLQLLGKLSSLFVWLSLQSNCNHV